MKFRGDVETEVRMGDYEGAKDAMVANAMCRARVGHCYCGDGYCVVT